MRRGVSGVVVSCLIAASTAGCGSVTGALRATARPARVPRPPRVAHARHLRPSAPGGLRFGSRVPARDLAGARVFADGRHGFALTSVVALRGETYPVASGDGGRSWHVAGPILHIPAAQGAVAVTQAGIEGPHFYYTWAGGGNGVVDVTIDGGRHWWQVFLPGAVLSVTADQLEARLGGGLTATVAGPTPDPSGRGASVWTYHTTDGRNWRYRSSFDVTS